MPVTEVTVWGVIMSSGALNSIVVYLINEIYRQTSNIIRTFVGNKIVDNLDVVGASPVGAASTTSSFLTQHLTLIDLAKTTTKRDEEHLNFGIGCVLY